MGRKVPHSSLRVNILHKLASVFHSRQTLSSFSLSVSASVSALAIPREKLGKSRRDVTTLKPEIARKACQLSQLYVKWVVIYMSYVDSQDNISNGFSAAKERNMRGMVGL